MKLNVSKAFRKCLAHSIREDYPKNIFFLLQLLSICFLKTRKAHGEIIAGE